MAPMMSKIIVETGMLVLPFFLYGIENNLQEKNERKEQSWEIYFPDCKALMQITWFWLWINGLLCVHL